MGFTLTTPPTVEPVSVLEAMQHLRLDTANTPPLPAEVTVVVVSPGASEGDESVPIAPLETPLSIGDMLKFDVGKVAVIAGTGNVDDETLTVEALAFDLAPGAEATVPTADSEISLFIAAARRQAERYTGAGIISQVWTLTLDGFPADGSLIPLPRGPVLSLDSITYRDAAGNEQVIADEPDADPPTTALSDLVVLDQTPLSASVSLVDGAAFPATSAQKGAVSIAFTVGYATSTVMVPSDLKAALLLLIEDLNRNRGAQQGSQIYKNERAYNILDGHVRTPLP